MGAKGKKVAMVVVPLVLFGGIGIAMAASGKKRTLQQGEAEGDEDGIDLDALPPSPSAVSMPGPPVPVSTEEDEGEPDEVSPGMPQVNPDERDTDVRLPGELQVPPTWTEPHLSIPVSLPSEVPIPNVQIPGVQLPPAVQLPQVPQAPQPQPQPQPIQVDQLTGRMIDELRTAERVANWKRTYPIVQQWQAAHGRTVDGKFGPKDGVYLATIAPDVPVVRYWPLSDGPNPQKALTDYRAALLAVAAQRPPDWAAGLQRASQIERGQSFGPPTGDGGKLPVSV